MPPPTTKIRMKPETSRPALTLDELPCVELLAVFVFPVFSELVTDSLGTSTKARPPEGAIFPGLGGADVDKLTFA